MKKLVLLTSSLLLAATITMAQDSPSSAATANPHDQSPTMSAQSTSSQSNVVRGCLSGSAGNFTVTDQSGVQYKLIGGDADLQSKVGHEVQVSGTQSQTTETSSGNGESMAHASNSLQVAGVNDISSHCSMSGGSTMQPMDNNAQPNENTSPKGASTTSEPPRPQEMAMLQQQTAPAAAGSASQDSAGSTTNATSSQSSQSTQQTSPDGTGAQTAPPVTSQTPAAPVSPTSSNSQMGASPANNSGTTTANPNATPGAATPQAGTDDANKPLYERQATDVPWASGSKGANTSAPSTNPQ